MWQKPRAWKKRWKRSSEGNILMIKSDTYLLFFSNSREFTSCSYAKNHKSFRMLSFSCYIWFFTARMQVFPLFTIKTGTRFLKNECLQLLRFPERYYLFCWSIFYISENRLVPLSLSPWRYFSSFVTAELQRIKDLINL